MIPIDISRRAGVAVSSPSFKELLSTLFASPAISVYGFYGHAGNSYASESLTEASAYLFSEVDAVNAAAAFALDMFSGSSVLDAHQQPFILSVGSTPTAHAASADTRTLLSKVLRGTLELHAGMSLPRMVRYDADNTYRKLSYVGSTTATY
jgi:D-serine deaminase-like pyridoxal phosphate-dependent protein